MDGRFRISKHFSMLDIQMFRMHENDNHRMNAHQLIQIVVFSTFYQTKIESKLSEYPRWSQYSKHKSTTNPHHPPLSLWRCCALMSWTVLLTLPSWFSSKVPELVQKKSYVIVHAHHCQSSRHPMSTWISLVPTATRHGICKRFNIQSRMATLNGWTNRKWYAILTLHFLHRNISTYHHNVWAILPNMHLTSICSKICNWIYAR